MKRSLARVPLEIRLSTVSGYGVFAVEKIGADMVIEEARVILIADRHVTADITDYLFRWEPGYCALALGYGSIYNNSDTPNAQFYKDAANNLLVFKALQDIATGEEIFVEYGDNWFQEHSHLKLLPPPHKNFFSRVVVPLVSAMVVGSMIIYILLW